MTQEIEAIVSLCEDLLTEGFATLFTSEERDGERASEREIEIEIEIVRDIERLGEREIEIEREIWAGGG